LSPLREIGLLARISLAWLAVSVVVFGLTMWGITVALEPGDLQLVMSGPLGDFPAAANASP
jgi:hypothetical protein